MKKERLYSLDLLRGIDIFFLTVCFLPILYFHRHWPAPEWVKYQFWHPAWEGFSVLDMVKPLFIFMAGAALPLALKKRLEPDGTAGWAYWGHVLKRVGFLWFLGLLAGGNLCSFDLHEINFFNNTLQAIAAGYLITAAVSRIPSVGLRRAVPFVLAGAYCLAVHTLGDLTPTGNFAVVYETKFLRLFYPESWANAHCIAQIAEWHYTWWATVPMFGVVSLAGYEATTIVLSDRTGLRKAGLLAATGAGLLALGFALLTFDPSVKHIMTASFTVLSSGVSFLLFALCYFIADVRGIRKGYSFILLFGRHSLFAYMMSGFFGFALVALFRKAFSNCGWDPFDGDGIIWSDARGLARFFSAETVTLLTIIGKSALICVAVWFWEEWNKRGRDAK